MKIRILFFIVLFLFLPTIAMADFPPWRQVSTEPLSDSWNNSTRGASQDSIYSWLVLFDTNLNGDLADEEWASAVTWPSGTAGDILYSGGGSDPTFGSYLDLPSLSSAPSSPVTGRAYKADNDNWDPADLSGTTDYWVIYDGSDYVLWLDDLGNQYFSSIDMTGGTFIIPNGTTDATLGSAGQFELNTTDEQLSFHSAADGEISGEAALSLIQHKSWSFDPAAVYGTTLHRMPLMTVGLDAPEGITIDKWAFTFDANPTAEIDADIKRATAFIGVGSAAVIDQLDTTDGASSEDTDANINSDAVVANGQVIYIEISTAYTETGHTCLLDIWYHYEED